MIPPLVDFLVSGHPTQSESQYTFTDSLFPWTSNFWINRGHPTRYLASLKGVHIPFPGLGHSAAELLHRAHDVTAVLAQVVPPGHHCSVHGGLPLGQLFCFKIQLLISLLGQITFRMTRKSYHNGPGPIGQLSSDRFWEVPPLPKKCHFRIHGLKPGRTAEGPSLAIKDGIINE